MSFFQKIKQGLGIGTATVQLNVPATIASGTKEVNGSLVLTAKSDQKVKSIKVALVETVTFTSGDEQRVQKKDIQTVYIKEPFSIKKDEQRTIPFTLSVDLGTQVSVGLFGGTLTLSGSQNNQQVYEFVAVADLDGVAIDPTDSKPVRFTGFI